MASFYQDMSDHDVKQHNQRFVENFRKEFGREPNIEHICYQLTLILEKKAADFVEQNYGDFPPTVIAKLKDQLPFHEDFPLTSEELVQASQEELESQPMPDYDQAEPEIQEVAEKPKKQKVKAKK